MTRQECFRVLAGARLARLACARENQPYVVPVYLAYDQVFGCLYGFTTPGQKIHWMRANPRVCVEVDEIAADDQWVSVIGIGRYEELSEPVSAGTRLHAPERPPHDSRYRRWEDEGSEDERDRAWQLLKAIHPVWWEPGCAAWAARVHRDPTEPLILVYFRIRLDEITGHEATPDPRDAVSHAVPSPPAEKWSWLRKTLTRMFGGRSAAARRQLPT